LEVQQDIDVMDEIMENIFERPAEQIRATEL
jgi:hypothetical protein